MDKTINLNKENNKINIGDKKISTAILSSFVVLMVQYFVLYFFKFNETNVGSILQLISKIIVGNTFLYAFPTVAKRNGKTLILIYSGVISIFLFNYLFFEINRQYLVEIIFKLFFICLPCFVYSYSLFDLTTFESMLKKANTIIYMFAIILGILVFTNTISLGAYSMTMSYYMLLPTIVFLKEFFESYSLKYLILSGIAILIMLAIGSRGAIMCLGVYIILYQLINFSKADLKKILIRMLIFSVLIFGVIFLIDILIVINNILNEFGIYSRSITLFLMDEVHLSGRNILYDEIIRQILLHPLIGIGIVGDRVYLNGSYVHNIFLEIFSSYGLIIGSLATILLIYITVKSLFSKNKYKANLLLIWFCVGFIPLLVSGSYLTDFQFWIFIGLTFNTISKQ